MPPHPLDLAYRHALYSARAVSFTFAPSPSPPDSPTLLPFAQPWAIITAHNPQSRPTPDDINRRAQLELVHAVDELHLPHTPAEGRSTDPRAPWSEPSLLVEHIDRPTILSLMRRFSQRACVYAAGDRAGLLYLHPERWEVLGLRIR